ncbi:hypothetical protein, partial [Desulfurobacterium sp.]
LSYKALGKDEIAKSVTEKIKNPELKLKTGLPINKITITTIQYDSNPIFIPEDETMNSFSGWIFNTVVKYLTTSSNSYRGIKAFISYQLNRDHKFLDYISLSPFFERKINSIKVLLNPYYIYTDNVSYLLGFQSTIKQKFQIPVSITAGGEINFKTSSKNALYAGIETKIKNASTSIFYKHFSGFPDKVSIKPKLFFEKEVINIKILTNPYINTRFYTDGSRNIIPGCTVVIEKNLSNSIKIDTELRYERGFGSGNLENDYSRYVIGLTFSGNF